MTEYKISLGVELDTSDIVSQINKAESQIDPIKIKIDAETKELTKSIQDALKTLSKGGQNTLTLDTSRFEGSIADIKSAVLDLKKTLVTLDDSANMKSLLSSVNQIANAIGKVTDESETLAKSLSVLSKKDFGFNFNLKTGNANPLKAATDYGIEARRKAIPAMKEQVAYLQDMLGGTEKAEKALERYLIKQNKGFGGVTEKNKLQREMLGGTDLDGKTISYNKQMGALEQMVDYYKKIAVESGNSLDGFNAKFSQTAESIVDDTVKIQTGVKQTEEAIEAAANEMKQMFGGGIGAEQLSAQLEPIVVDLNQIREAVQSLSSGVSLEGLTASFDRLSSAIENLLTNAERVKGVLNSGFDNSIVDTSTSSTPSSAVKSAQQTGQKIGETVKQSVKQSLTLDDVIDEQVQNLMNQYGIVGKKGSKAFGEIKQAIVEYRAELALLNSTSSVPDGFDEIGMFEDDVADIRKVTDALTSNMKVADQTKEVYQDLAAYIKQINNSGHKVFLPDSIKQEYGDDFASMRSQLGKAFTTQRTSSSVDFESWVGELNSQLGNVIDLSHGAEAAFGDLVNKVNSAKGNKLISGDEAIKSGQLDIDEIEAEVITALGAIEAGESSLAQASVESANVVIQNEERKQQAYRETADAAEQVSKIKIGNTELDALSLKDDIDEADKLSAALSKLKSIQGSINKIEIGEIDISKGVQEIQVLEQQLESLSREYNETVAEINGMGGVSATQLQSFQNDIDNTNRKIEQLQTNLREKIQTAIDTSVARDVQKAHSDFDKLSNKTKELRQSMQQLDDIKIDLDTAKEQGDIQKLSELYTRYLNILKDVNTQLDINKRAENDAHRSSSFELDKERAMHRLNNLFSENSEAARRFGSDLNRLQKELDECGDTKGLQRINKEITNLSARVKETGAKTKTFGQDLKEQFSKYSSYFSIAELFMWVEQGLRDMFEQVKLIDSAMTELKKVTDESDASYDRFLTNAASRAKEIGTTIDGLVSSTADFARLGYGFEDAQGLAGVANIYAVVGDEVEGVEGATKSLISTMAAFKGEMNGMSNTDFAMSIIDSMNALGNAYAISSGGLGEALQRSASSLAAANNTLHESAAMITAANTVTQNPEKVGKIAMPTIKMAISVKNWRQSRPRKDFISILIHIN